MGLYHDFWLLEEKTYPYSDYDKFLIRKDAPIRIHDEHLRYFVDTLAWIPTLNPAKKEMPTGLGLNWYGLTIINQMGGIAIHHTFTGWTQIFTQGPEHLTLRGSFVGRWPFSEREHLISEDQLCDLGKHEYLEVDRDKLIEKLKMLAAFGEQAASGAFYILHCGI